MAGHYLIHIGEGDERETYDCDFNKMLNVEFIAIERFTGLTVQGVAQGLEQASSIAVTSIVWVLRRRKEPGLRFEDVQFVFSEVEIEDLDDKDESEAPKEDSTDSDDQSPPEAS